MASRVFVKRAMVTALVVFTLAGSRPAWAQTAPNSSDQCMSQLASCYYWAAAQAGFWSIWAGGIDCELQMVDCIRRAITGH